ALVEERAADLVEARGDLDWRCMRVVAPQLEGLAMEARRLRIETEVDVDPPDGVEERGLHVGLPLQLTADALRAGVEDLAGGDGAAVRGVGIGDLEEIDQELGDLLGLEALAVGAPLLQGGERDGN